VGGSGGGEPEDRTCGSSTAGTTLCRRTCSSLRSRACGPSDPWLRSSLGVDGLERSVAAEPLRRVYECALAVLAME